MPRAGPAPAPAEGHAGVRSGLRARTAAAHARLDRSIEACCLGAPPDLRRLLAVHCAALGAIVPALERAGAARLFPGWDGRSRLSALEADLAELGADRPRRPGAAPSFPSHQEVWGALYAVEGSRLGNRVLLRRLAEHGSDLGQRATRFLAHRPEDAAAWPRLLARIEALDYRGEDFEAAVRGAERVFGAYLVAVERHLGPKRPSRVAG
jgi:heme oxygenase